jgi:hypothetical protein
MESNTQKGLYFLIIGLIITMICSLITSLSSFFTKDIFVSMFMSMFGIIALVGAILMIIGAIMFFMGRKEFGEKHQKNVKKALIIFVITFVTILAVAAIFIIMMIFSALSTMSITDHNTSFVASTFAAPTSLLIIIISIIGAVLGGLIYYFALIELEDETGKKILYAGIVSSIAISLLTSFYLAGTLNELFSSIAAHTTDFSALPYTQNISKISILGIISNLLYLYAFYNPYKRMKDGGLVPVTASAGQEPSPTRLCPNCGKTIPSNTNICPYCNKEI